MGNDILRIAVSDKLGQKKKQKQSILTTELL
jgi:hypothetical protein